MAAVDLPFLGNSVGPGWLIGSADDVAFTAQICRARHLPFVLSDTLYLKEVVKRQGDQRPPLLR